MAGVWLGRIELLGHTALRLVEREGVFCAVDPEGAVIVQLGATTNLSADEPVPRVLKVYQLAEATLQWIVNDLQKISEEEEVDF